MNEIGYISVSLNKYVSKMFVNLTIIFLHVSSNICWKDTRNQFNEIN